VLFLRQWVKGACLGAGWCSKSLVLLRRWRIGLRVDVGECRLHARHHGGEFSELTMQRVESCY
jgi:hypothetical protein